MPKKISHIDTDMMRQDDAKRTELDLPDGGRIISYHPFKSMQIIFLMCIHHIYLIYGSLGSARVMKVDI